MTPRQMQKLIHDLGFTTNTAKIPGTDYYTIIIDFNEKEPHSSKFCIDTIGKLTFAMQTYTTDNIDTEVCWVGNLYIKQVTIPFSIFASFVLNTENQVLTITIYSKWYTQS